MVSSRAEGPAIAGGEGSLHALLGCVVASLRHCPTDSQLGVSLPVPAAACRHATNNGRLRSASLQNCVAMRIGGSADTLRRSVVARPSMVMPNSPTEGRSMSDLITTPSRRRRRETASIIVALLAIGTACTDQQTNDQSFATDETSLSVQSRNNIGISLRDSSLSIGDTARIQWPTYSAVKTASSRSGKKYFTSDSTVLTIDDAGLVRAVRDGRATVTARMSSGATGSIVVAVSAGPVLQAPPPASAPPSGALPSFVTPQLPSVAVIADLPSAPSRSFRIAAGDAAGLQAALNSAVGGDEIVLADGGVYSGAFHLPNRAGGGTVVVRSNTVPVSPHTRITPSTSASLATLVTTSVFPALAADDGAHGWRVIGVRMRLADGVVDNYGIVTLGGGSATAASQFPHDVVLDRVAIIGSTNGSTSRCLSLNGNALAVIDSWLAECHASGRDAQAVASWSSTGPLLIENNHLEGSGQAILLGGSDPLIAGVIPSDVTIRRNHLYKPMSWAGRWTVKAAFEIKNAKRVLFESNVIENHWADAQVGFAILMQAVTQDGRAPWSTIADVTLRANVIRNSRSGVNILSRVTSGTASVPNGSRRIVLHDNSFENVGVDPVSGGTGRYVQLLEDLQDVTLIQNTFFGPGAANAVMFDGSLDARLVLANNVFGLSTYGILGSGFGEGVSSLTHFAPGAVVSGNVFAGIAERSYPAGNAFPSTLTALDFVGAATGNYGLLSSLPFSVLNGARTGVDGGMVTAETSGVTAR